MSASAFSYKRHRFSARTDHACCVAVFELPPELQTDRGNAARARDCCIIRDSPLLEPEIRARRLRRKRAASDNLWLLNEVRIVIRGQPHWLWRAVDQDGYILDEILQTCRNMKAARACSPDF